MIRDSGFELTVPQLGAPGSASWPARLSPAQSSGENIQRRLGRRLAWVGRGCLVVFAAVALISANRGAGLLTVGALTRVSSEIRGEVRVGAVYLLLPLGAALWLAGELMKRRALNQRPHWRVGPAAVAAPLVVLIALTLAHLGPAIGQADITFVLAGLGLLVMAYLFVLHDGLDGAGLAAFLAIVGSVQAVVAVGQFASQQDLGLSWLGEISLDPSAVGVSVLSNSARVLRAYGLMRHPNALGAILPLSLLAAVSLWSRATKRARIVWLVSILVITAGLAVSFSRAGWLAALAGGGVMLAAQRAPGREGGNSSRRPAWISWAPVLLTAAVVVLVPFSIQPGLFLGRFIGAFGAGSGLEHGSISERLYSLKVWWDVIHRWPLWGVGTRQYVVVAAKLMNVTPREALLVESTPLLLWAEQGLLGPVAWLGMGLALIWLGCRRGQARGFDPDLALATAWVAAIQVVCLFQPYFWPGHELWQGGIWLGAALGLWARAWTHSACRSPAAAPAGLASNHGPWPTALENSRQPGTSVSVVHRPGPG